MTRRILIIQGHPDPSGRHLCHALADAYADGAAYAGHEVSRIDVAKLDFPLLRSKEDFDKGKVPFSLRPCLDALANAQHIVIVHPLWLGEMPALLKGFCEQMLRPGFAFDDHSKGFPIKRMAGKSAHIVVTMGMPAFVYRWYYGAHGLKNLKRNILGFCGFAPITDTLFGMVEHAAEATRERWRMEMYALGRQG